MEPEEKSRLVAFARLLGVSGTDVEIFDRYWEYYQNALKTFTIEPKPKKDGPLTTDIHLGDN